MTANQRIAINALATYGRTVFAMVLGLFSSRWVLQSLGTTDYGLMAVVGSLIVFVTFLNSVSGGACTRFFALSIGRGDEDETNWWFNTALSIHIVLPTVLVLIGWPLGEWAVGHFLSIPADRVATARWVFRFSLVSAFFAMSSTPFIAMYTAKQNIYELSLWGFLTTLLNFGFVWWLTGYKGDSWFVYSMATVMISVVIGLCQVFRAGRCFGECRIDLRRWWNSKRLLEVFSFSGWTIFGGLGWLAHSNGMAVVLNKFFPPGTFGAVNASYSVGSGLANHTQTLSNALMTAFMPAIVSAEGRGERSVVIAQVLRAARLAFAMCAVFALPLVSEADYVLKIWLKTPPEYASLFCRTFLVTFILARLGSGLDAAINATGRIKWYQILNSCFFLGSLPLAIVVVTYGGGVSGVCGVLVVMNILNLCGMLFFACHLVGLPIRRWGLEVFLPALTVVVLTLVPAVLLRFLIVDLFSGMIRFFIIATIAAIVAFITSWLVIFRRDERKSLSVKMVGILTGRFR